MSEYIQLDGDNLIIITPYNASFIEDLKKSISERKWNGSLKAWIVPKKNLETVENLIKKHYGVSGKSSETKTLKIEAIDDVDSNCRESVQISGIPIVRATGRDSGAWVCDGVSLISGEISSKGSVKNWFTQVKKGTILTITVPLDFILEDGNWKDLSNYDTKKENLLKEKENLLKRLSEIEKELGEL